MNKKVSTATADERDAKVRAVLLAASEPLDPTEIARRISEPWCCFAGKPAFATSAPISAVLKRIDAVGFKGKWTLSHEGG